jgi:diguanylate cyclase (GGDEF)-like protein/putative nucleotidyltransferase with HDIG domain
MRLRALPGQAVRTDLQSLNLSIQAGVWTTFGVTVAAAVWVAATWSEPQRLPIISLWVVALIGAMIISALPAERILSSGRRDLFYFLWSTMDVALIAVIASLDRGARSPFVLLFFLTLVFAATFYPLRLVVSVGVLTVIAFLIVGLAESDASAAYLFFFSTCLAATAYMCVWQARSQERQRDELVRVSRSDPLTGALNRRGFEERLRGELDRAERSGRPFGLVLVDLDGFKRVNDEYGHAAGDELLGWVVQALESGVRPMDAVGRLGGDEFGVLLPGAGRADMDEVLNRIEEKVCPRVPCSIGAARFPIDGSNVEQLLAYADGELYAGKRQLSSENSDLSWATALAETVDARLNAEHSRETARVAAAIAERLGWDDAQVGLLRIASMLHDVGKVAMSDRVLQKPGSLSGEERREVEQHPITGAAIVARINGMEAIVPWIRHSHEHFDGSGYPDGLAGEAIPLASRIMLVADAYDVIRSERPYKRPHGAEAALNELRRCSGTQLDPACVDALSDLVEEGALAVEARVPEPIGG